MKYLIDKNWLEQKYLNENLGIKQIAKLKNISEGTVYNRILHFGIPLRNKGPQGFYTKMTRSELYKWYIDENMTCKEIAKKLATSTTAIRQALIYHKIPRRIGRIRDRSIKANYLKADTFVTVARLRKAMIFLYGKHCQIPQCDYSIDVDVHHLIGKGYRGQGGRKHTNNRISESILVCPNHHRESHLGIVTQKILQESIKKRKLKT